MLFWQIFPNWGHWVWNGNPPIDVPKMTKKHRKTFEHPRIPSTSVTLPPPSQVLLSLATINSFRNVHTNLCIPVVFQSISNQVNQWYHSCYMWLTKDHQGNIQYYSWRSKCSRKWIYHNRCCRMQTGEAAMWNYRICSLKLHKKNNFNNKSFEKYQNYTGWLL